MRTIPLCCCEDLGLSSRILYVLLITHFRIPRHVVYPAAHIPSADSPSTIPVDDATSDADISLLTPQAKAPSSLLAHGLNTRPIRWSTVPKATHLVRVCLYVGNTSAGG